MALQIIWNDIRRERTDVIVTTASRKARVGTGLDRILHEAAGPGLLAARRELGAIGPGKIGVTPAFGLEKLTGARHVIHALGPVWVDGEGDFERHMLEGVYFRVLCKAVALKARTLSLPVLSSGKFGMPMPLAVDTAVSAIEAFLEAVPELEVKLVGVDSDFRDYARAHYPALTVLRYSQKSETAYRQKYKRSHDDALDDPDESLTTTEPQAVFRRQKLEIDVKGRDFTQLFRLLWARKVREERAKRKTHATHQAVTSFSRLEVETGISSSNLKHIHCGESKTPGRELVIALAVGLGLPPAYAKALMSACRYRFASIGRDPLILDYLRSGGSGIVGLNPVLESAGFSPLYPMGS